MFLGATAALTGCSILVSTEGLSGTLVVIGGEGGGADADQDAGHDAEAGPPPPFCASLVPLPVLCADFDKDALTAYGEIQGNPPMLDTTLFTSPARSMLAVVEPDATNRSSRVVQTSPTTPTSLQVSFSVYVEEYDVSFDVELMSVRLLVDATKSCTLVASIRTNQWTLDEICYISGAPVAVLHRSPIVLKKGRWTRVWWAADFGARTLSLTVDDQKPFVGLVMQGALASGPTAFGMGIGYLQVNATRVKAHFDDVVYDFH